MNNFQKVGLATIAACSMSFAAGDLWGTDIDEFPSLQAQVPDAVTCWQNDPPSAESACYTTTGGWFYGYAENGGSTLKAYIDGDWVDFAVPTGSPPLTDNSGNSKIGSSFNLRYYAGPAESESKPGLAAVGFNMKKDPKTGGENVADRGGICVVYASDAPLKIELGWDETAFNYNTFQASLPASTEGKMIDLAWDASATGKTSGDFARLDWEPVFDIEKALTDLRSIKFPLKNEFAVPINANFALCEIGWKGTCSGSYTCDPIITPILPGTMANANVNLIQAGRILSLSADNFNKPVPVQVINLQGAVVHSKTYAPGEKINLNSLPTGVYMIRVPALGYTNKVIFK